MKTLFTILALFTLASCESSYQKDAAKTAKQRSASDRINSTNENSDNLLKELEQ